jgi:hypothetical protein
LMPYAKIHLLATAAALPLILLTRKKCDSTSRIFTVNDVAFERLQAATGLRHILRTRLRI